MSFEVFDQVCTESEAECPTGVRLPVPYTLAAVFSVPRFRRSSRNPVRYSATRQFVARLEAYLKIPSGEVRFVSTKRVFSVRHENKFAGTVSSVFLLGSATG